MSHSPTHPHSHEEPWLPYSGRGHRDPQAGQPAVQVEHLCVRYRKTSLDALSAVSLEVAVGQRVALVGPNGAGKSTLLKTLAGLVKPQSGRVALFGNPVGACHHRTAYLPQRTDLDWLSPMTVADLVMTGRYVHLGWLRWPGPADHVRVRRVLERMGIADLAERQIGELSGGQQQRTLLARALVQEASLFLLDEPLNAVDEATRDIVDDVLTQHTQSGGSVLVATHDLGRLAEWFDISVYLREGRVQNILSHGQKSPLKRPSEFTRHPASGGASI
ncbi:MAG: ABC transporter ATP-binding protein [Pirellulales bacterium]